MSPATWPADPKVGLKLAEANFAAADEMLKAGIVKEFGTFGPGDGYMMAEFPSFEEALKLGQRFWPGMTMEIREIISWEKTKEIVLSILKEQAE